MPCCWCGATRRPSSSRCGLNSNAPTRVARGAGGIIARAPAARGGRQGGQSPLMSTRFAPGLAGLLAIVAVAVHPGAAVAPPDPLVTPVRSWSAPENTPLVLEFRAAGTPAAPDPGEAPR